MSKKPYKLRALLKKLKSYGIVQTVRKDRGKGSEIVLVKPQSPKSMKGPQYPIKNHGQGTEISIPVINAICRRFGITDFWD